MKTARAHMAAAFAARYAMHTLFREKWRLAVVLLCIACGVASFTALQLLAESIRASALPDSRAQLGGDLALSLPGEAPIPPERMRALHNMTRHHDIILSPLAEAQANFARSTDSGRLAFLNNVVAVDPLHFPAAGELRVDDGIDTRAILLRGQALVTRDIAQRLDISPGDRIVIGGGDVPAFELDVGGIVTMTPNRRGLSLFYSLDRARTAIPGYRGPTRILLADETSGSGASAALRPVLAKAGWIVRAPALARIDSTGRVIDLLLRGASLMALIVAMIGVILSVRLFMARRRTEFAVLAALGSRRSDIFRLTAIEALFLGGTGALLGVAAGIGLAGWLVSRLSSTGLVFLIDLRMDAWTIALSWALGVAITLSACTWAALLAADRWPARSFRQSATGISAIGGGDLRCLWPTWAGTLLIAVGSLGGEIITLAGVVAGLAALVLAVALFAGLLAAIARLPLAVGRHLRTAQTNLTRRKWSTATALSALAIGLFTIHLAAAAWWSSYDRLQTRENSAPAANRIHLTLPASELAPVLPALSRRYADDLMGGEVSIVRPATFSMNGNSQDLRIRLFAPLTGGPSETMMYPSRSDDVRIRKLGDDTYGSLTIGDETLPARLGTGRPSGFNPTFSSTTAVGISLERLLSLSGDGSASVIVEGRTAAASARLLHDMSRVYDRFLVYGDSDIRDATGSVYRGLFALAGAMASLSVAIGIALLANSVALAVYERKAEHALLRALGYSRAQILALISTEFGLFGFIGAFAAIGGAAGAVWLVNAAEPLAQLKAPFWQAPVLIIFSSVAAALIASGIARLALRAPPMAALRGE
ncbi:FtsX-like permease family protein [Sphingosinicella rhizophila]|uniref:FtsX-like permease family protein n=1 Tax=Sphingosinicella rhizophila TaxID=3050082 RepID=A0ABU3Q5H1_9SPHN|nr:FtsX-like permease family protein [Sphingosinicella sp. GR2756]MDT9598658.1 FtsX-like permease family protein [Sphingosinicella sp. GR2756]